MKITYCNNIFSLSFGESSYVLSISSNGKIVFEYFGQRLTDKDIITSLIRDYPCPEGSSLLEEENDGSGPQNMALEYSLPFRGDFHEPSLILEKENSVIFDFRYDSYEIKNNAPIPGLPSPKGEGQELVIKCLDHAQKCSLYLHYIIFEDSDVLGKYLEIHNEDGSLLIKKASSSQLCLSGSHYSLLSLHGAWAGEANLSETPLKTGVVSLSSNNGMSSPFCNPFFMIEEEGCGRNYGAAYGFNLLFSGNHEESLEVDAFGSLRIKQGISSLCFNKELKENESFFTPLAIMCRSEKGRNGVSQQMHHYVNSKIIDPRFSKTERPIVYNNWEATMFSFNEDKIHSLMKKAKQLGIETFVLDDGWFGLRNDDTKGLGDWEVNPKKLPHGLKGLSNYAKKLGLKFGIWMEPEMVNKDSDLYRSHPDWIIGENRHKAMVGRHQFVLDLRKPEVQDFIFESVHKTLLAGDISFLKWDCNRSHSDIPDGYSSFDYDYYVGLYSVLTRIKTAHPEVLFENCASGGGRHDLGMLSFFPQSWVSDDTDPVQRNVTQSGLALGYPLSTLSNHVSAKTSNQLLRLTSLEAKFDCAAFGVLGYELDLNDLSVFEEKTIKAQINFYKEHRSLFQRGTYFELASYQKEGYSSLQVSMGEESIVSHLRFLQSPSPIKYRLKALELSPENLYSYKVRKEMISLKKAGHLINMISPIHLKEDGFLVNLLSQRKGLESEKEEGIVSGAAFLSYGVPLAQEWSGVGLNERVRILGDFSGRLYFIKKYSSK